MKEKNLLGFAGKVVSFGIKEDTLAIINPEFKYQNGRLFLVGSIPKGETNNDWAEGRPCGIAWDAVTEYIVFDSVEQYIELLAKSTD